MNDEKATFGHDYADWDLVIGLRQRYEPSTHIIGLLTDRDSEFSELDEVVEDYTLKVIGYVKFAMEMYVEDWANEDKDRGKEAEAVLIDFLMYLQRMDNES